MERPEYERRKMHNSPRNHVAIAMQVAFALVVVPSSFAISRATNGLSAGTAIVPDSEGDISQFSDAAFFKYSRGDSPRYSRLSQRDLVIMMASTATPKGWKRRQRPEHRVHAPGSTNTTTERSRGKGRSHSNKLRR
jgi:hypothetical protein